MLERAVALEGGDRAGAALPAAERDRAPCLKLWVGRYDEARAELTALRLAAMRLRRRERPRLPADLARRARGRQRRPRRGRGARRRGRGARRAGRQRVQPRLGAVAARDRPRLPRRRRGGARRRARRDRDLRALRGAAADAVGRGGARRARAVARRRRRGVDRARAVRGGARGARRRRGVRDPARARDRGADRARRARAGRAPARPSRAQRERERPRAGRWPRARAAARCCWPRAATCPRRAQATERALAAHARVELPFERARALLVQGQIARRRKQKRAARESLDAALALFEPLGARAVGGAGARGHRPPRPRAARTS